MLFNSSKLLKTIGYVLLLTSIVLAAFWRILFFGFWIDDWPLLWAHMYNLSYSLRFYNHPGLPLQFLLLTPIFGTNTYVWMVYGLLIKILVAFLVGVFFEKFTKSRLVGFLSGIFFAASYAGFEIMTDPAANTPGIIAIPILLSLILFVGVLEGRKKLLLWSGALLLIAFLLDPARVIPVFLLLPFFFFFFPKTKANVSFQKLLIKLYVVGSILLIPLMLVWFGKYEYDSQISHALVGFVHSPIFILSKLNRFGNLFASIANLFVGIFYSLQQDAMNTAMYQRIFGIIGVGIFLVMIGCLYLAVKQKSQYRGMVAFLLFWIFIFYLPNFLSEPRAPMAGPHRYLFLSSIGFVGLLAYLMSKIHTRWIVAVLSCIFIILNIYKANSLLSWQSSYRSAGVIDGLWNIVLHDVGSNKTNTILMFSGKEPLVGQALNYPNAWGFMVKEKLNISANEFPVVTTDEKQILGMLCGKTQYTDTRGKLFSKQQVAVSHLYSWEVMPTTQMKNTSLEMRKHFVQLAKQKGCTVKI